MIRKALILALLPLAASASAQTIVDKWKSVPLPPIEAPLPTEVDARTTALLILDMYPTSCNAQARPSCPAAAAKLKLLLERARARGMRVIYSAGPPAQNGPTDPVPELARRAGDGLVRGPADKFYGSDLEKMLADGGIKSVIVTGTSADGAVLYTASSASLRGLTAVVPVDTMASKEPFAELYTVYHLKNSTASIMRNVVVTRSDLVTIK